jgi:hypothetical protein
LQSEGGRFEPGNLHGSYLTTQGGVQHVVHTTSNSIDSRHFVDYPVKGAAKMRGNEVVWTIAGILFIICQVVWLIDNVNL